MSETLYTIPVNEAFDACADNRAAGCPFCRLYNILEENEVGILLGAAMMEPDIRIRTNEAGFCPTHFDRLTAGKNRLSFGLILESHLDTLRRELEEKGLTALLKKPGSSAPKRLSRLEGSCYVCDRIGAAFSRMLSNAVLLWEEDETFRAKTQKQPYFCLPHFRAWLETAQKEMKKGYADFYREVSKPVFAYYDELKNDVSWFCKKFDYRYDAEPWGNAKDAIERTRAFLEGDLHKPVTPPSDGKTREGDAG